MYNFKGLIPVDVINEIKSKNDIVNYISSKQELFKRGKNYYGKCHICGSLESFVVYPGTNLFYCFVIYLTACSRLYFLLNFIKFGVDKIDLLWYNYYQKRERFC